MPDEENSKQQNSQSLPGGVKDNELNDDAVNSPPPTNSIQEQIPPVHSTISRKTLIKKLTILLLMIILLAAAGFALWKFVINKKDEARPAQQSQSQDQPETNINQDNQSTPEELTQNYKSDFLMLGFNYPQSWKVTEADNVILVKSPTFQIKEKNGNQSDAYFKIYIKRGTSTTDGKYLAKGYAIKDSEKIAYKDPAAAQRKETNLTVFGLDTPDNFSYFVVQGSFTLAKGDTLGPKFAQEPDSFLIAGGFSADDQADGLATKTVSTEEYANNQAYLTAVEIIKSLKIN